MQAALEIEQAHVTTFGGERQDRLQTACRSCVWPLLSEAMEPPCLLRSQVSEQHCSVPVLLPHGTTKYQLITECEQNPDNHPWHRFILIWFICGQEDYKHGDEPRWLFTLRKKPRSTDDIFIDQAFIEKVEHFKFLGVVID